MKKKLATVFLTVITALSLVFGFAAINETKAQATTDGGDLRVVQINDFIPTWNRLCIKTNSSHNTDAASNHAQCLEYLTYTRSGVNLVTADCLWLREDLYFGVQQNGQYVTSAQNGDRVTIKEGLTFLEGETLKTTVSYTYDGSKWVEGTDVPVTPPIEGKEISVTGVAMDTSYHTLRVYTTSSYGGNDTSRYPSDNFVYERKGETVTVGTHFYLGNSYSIEIRSATNELIDTAKVGDLFTINSGAVFTPTNEVIKQNSTYVYNGTAFVTLVEPTSFTLAEPSVTMNAGTTHQITVNDDANVTAVYTYESADTSVATVNDMGVITAVNTGTTKITVSYKDLKQEMTVKVEASLTKTALEILNKANKFYVPVSTAEEPTSFASMGYTLKARFVFEGGEYGSEFEVEEQYLGAVDYTTAGNYKLAVTIEGLTDEVDVVVYEYRKFKAFNSLGIDGYDLNDSDNQPGTWNGNMIIGIASASTNTANITGGAMCEKISEYIVYKTAEGKYYYGKGDEANGVKGRINAWQVGTNYLIMIKPEGAKESMGFADPDRWKADAEYEYAPIYKLGDSITFMAGMPVIRWIGSIDSNNMPVGDGYYIIEGYLEEDVVYYCYEQDEEKSLWQIYKEYTDFTLEASKTVSVGQANVVGAVKVPADATTGTFSYESSDIEIVEVTKDGNLLPLKTGTATITVTLTGGKDAEGNALEAIVKTIEITVENAVVSVSGSITVAQGSVVDLSKYEVTVTYSDGSTVQVKLSDERIVVEDIYTDNIGEESVIVLFTEGNMRGNLIVKVVDPKDVPTESESSGTSASESTGGNQGGNGNQGNQGAQGGGGCLGTIGGCAALSVLAAAATVVIARKKREE